MPDGYTDESLKMLETAEGQTNAVFACFGSAAQHAQTLEQALVRFLHISGGVSGHALPLDKLTRQTLGALIRELQNRVKFDNPQPTELLADALDSRNFLMHHFFLKRDVQLGSEAGRFSLLAELTKIENQLDNGRVVVNAMRIALCRALGIEDPHAAEYADPNG